MKKVIPGVIVLVAVAAAAFVFLKKAVIHHTRAVDLAPAETIFFAHLPDVRRTAERWPKTGLAAIGREPEMQAFLAKPRAAAPQMKMWETKEAQLERVEPGEAFVAVTSIDGNQPKFLAGFSFSGSKAAAEALLAEGREQWKSSYPAGKSDITLQGKTEIETFSYQDTVMGEAYVGDWYFISNDLGLLRQTINAAPHGLGDKALAANEFFKKSMAKVPADGEIALFAQTGVLTERLVSLLVASGQPMDPKQIAELKKIQAVTWVTRFEDTQIRDSLFMLSPGNAEEKPLERSTLALSGADTFLAYATNLPTSFDLPDSSAALSAFIPGLGSIEKALSDKGLKWSDFPRAFGPEFGTVVNWTPTSGQPSALVGLAVKDPAMAKSFVEVLTSGLAGAPPWGRQEQDGATIYQGPASPGIISISPYFALTDRFFVLGFSASEVSGALTQLKSGQAIIAASPAYQQAAKSVGTPTGAFGYLDLKTLFERSYGVMRPLLAMSLAFSPDAGKYVDAGKLPSTETISKHLTPSVYSQSVSADGTLVESVGTLTFNQVIAGVVGGSVAAAFPMIENALSSGLKLDPSSLLPGPNASPVTPPVVEPDPAPAAPSPAPKSDSPGAQL